MKTLLISAAALLMLTGCQTTISGSETEAALCDVWGDTLFLPSRQDTIETARGLTRQNQVHGSVCG